MRASMVTVMAVVAVVVAASATGAAARDGAPDLAEVMEVMRKIQASGGAEHHVRAARRRLAVVDSQTLNCSTINTVEVGYVGARALGQSCIYHSFQVNVTGDVATYSADGCSGTAYCNASTTTCLVETAPGGNCTTDEQCTSNHDCKNGVCSLDHESGGPCTLDTDCTATNSTCSNGVCTGLAAYGACDSTWSCVDNFYCNSSDVCSPILAWGQACTEYGQCGGSAVCAMQASDGSGMCYQSGMLPNGVRPDLARLLVLYLSATKDFLNILYGPSCVSGYMNATGYCQAPPSGGVAVGGACAVSSQCAFGSACICTGSGAGTCYRNMSSTATARAALLQRSSCMRDNGCNQPQCPPCDKIADDWMCTRDEFGWHVVYAANVFPKAAMDEFFKVGREHDCNAASGIAPTILAAAATLLLAALVVV